MYLVITILQYTLHCNVNSMADSAIYRLFLLTHYILLSSFTGVAILVTVRTSLINIQLIFKNYRQAHVEFYLV